MSDAERHIEAAMRYVIGGECQARENYPNLAGDFSAIANELSMALESLRAQEGLVMVPRDIEWVVNSIAELGVKIGNQFFWLYKGRSLVYGTDEDGDVDNGIAMNTDDDTPLYWRPVGKREFGECCHPVNYADPTRCGTVDLSDSDEWQPLPAAAQSTEQNAGGAVEQNAGELVSTAGRNTDGAGGGTPSSLPSPALDKLVEQAWQFYELQWGTNFPNDALMLIGELANRIESDAAEKEQLKRRIAELWRSNDRHAKDHLKCINKLNLAQRKGKLAIERAEKAEAAHDALDKCYEELQKAMSRMAARKKDE